MCRICTSARFSISGCGDDNLRDRKINPGHPRYYHCDKWSGDCTGIKKQWCESIHMWRYGTERDGKSVWQICDRDAEGFLVWSGILWSSFHQRRIPGNNTDTWKDVAETPGSEAVRKILSGSRPVKIRKTIHDLDQSVGRLYRSGYGSWISAGGSRGIEGEKSADYCCIILFNAVSWPLGPWERQVFLMSWLANATENSTAEL